MSYHWTGVLRLFVGLGRRFLSQHFLVHIFFWLALSLQFFTEFHNFLIDDLQLKYNTVIKKLYIHELCMTTLHDFCVKGNISSQQAAHKDIPGKLDAVSETVSIGMIVYISIMYFVLHPSCILQDLPKVMFHQIWIYLWYESLTLLFE